MHKTTVLLAEDHTVVRKGIRSLLEIQGDVEIVGEAENGRQALAMARKLRPAVVVMDIAMPLLNGFEATRQILASVPGTRILILSAHDDDDYVDECIALGVSGFLMKQTSLEILSEAIRELVKGNSFYGDRIAGRLDKRNREIPDHAGKLRKQKTNLSPREHETLQLIAEGFANKQIADELGISVKTVEKHRHRLMIKLDIHDTAGLTRYAIAAGIIEGGTDVWIT